MIVQCDDCHKRYDDEFRSTICPHEGINGLCVKHDLYGCYLCMPDGEDE